VKYNGDKEIETIEKKFDFEHDLWPHPITLNANHFKDGILAI
jgi:hypothetical protein